MDYEILHGITNADIAVRVKGGSASELFTNAGNTLMSELTDDISTINRVEHVTGLLQNSELDMLYFAFLNEFLFYKDSRSLLLLPETVEVTEGPGIFTCIYTLAGEKIDPDRHSFKVDIKAVTLHCLRVYHHNDTYIAETVFDV